MGILIQWVRSAFHRLPTIGREWAALWVDFHSTYQLILCIPGIFKLPTIFTLEAGGAGYREALMIFFVLCHTAGVPLSWSKTAGGDTVICVGFEILHRSFSLGVSERRAEWFVKWSETIASARYVNMDSFEEGLGRIVGSFRAIPQLGGHLGKGSRGSPTPSGDEPKTGNQIAVAPNGVV